MENIKVVKSGETWVVPETTHLNQLTIEEGGALAAPEGKVVALSVDGRGYDSIPGHYYGNIVLSVADPFMLAPSCIFRESGRWSKLRTATVIRDNKIVENESLSAHIVGGEISGKSARDIRITSIDPHFNGLVITGDSNYLVDNGYFAFEGKGDNDFEGAGAGVACYENARVDIKNTNFNFNAVTRCVLHAGGNSIVHVSDSELRNDSPHTDMRPAWVMGLDGTNRTIQLCDSAAIEFDNCYLKGNGWGVISVDGPIQTRMTLRNTKMELSGTRARGYGAFVFGDCKAEFDHCELDVNGYPILMNTEHDAYALLTNGTVVKAPLYGMQAFRDCGGRFIVEKGSSIHSGRACMTFKGGCTYVTIDDASLVSDEGIICQVTDNDDPGVMVDHYCPPIGEVDVPVEGRDLTEGRTEYDVFVDIKNSQLKGDFLNSTTNLRANSRVAAGAHFDLNDDALNATVNEGAHDSTDEEDPYWEDPEQQGPKNLVIKLENASIVGIVSSASQKYRDDVTRIDTSNPYEISNIFQTPAPTVNNGVILSLDNDSKWVVTGKSYLTSLSIAETAIVSASRMTVDGVETPIAPGVYKGAIVIE